MNRVSLSMVGVRGFEPPTPCTPCRCANRTALHPVSSNGAIVSLFSQICKLRAYGLRTCPREKEALKSQARYRMPVYEYECNACHFRFERKGRFDQEPVSVCPECQGKVYRIFPSPQIMGKDEWKSRE